MSFKNKIRLMMLPTIFVFIVIILIINFLVTGFQMKDMQYELMGNRVEYIIDACNRGFNEIRTLGMEDVDYFNDATKRKVLEQIEDLFVESDNIVVIDIKTGDFVFSLNPEEDNILISQDFLDEIKSELHVESDERSATKLLYIKNKLGVYNFYNNWDWLIIETVDRSYVYRYILDAIVYSIIAAAFFFILLFVIIYKFSYTISDRLENLEKGTIQISDGDFDLDISIESNDEFGKLADSFNIMASEIKDRKDEIIKQKERLAVTLRSIGDGVITTDINDNIMIMNRIAEELTGWKQLEALGKPISTVFNCMIYDDVTKQNTEEGVKKVILSEHAQILISHTILITKSGKEVLIEDSAAPIFDEMNKVIGTVIVFRDYTEQKRHADELMFAKEKAEEHSNSKSQFLANMSHEIRTPMNGVLGMIQLIQETSLTKEQKEYVNISQTSSEALMTVINDILDYSKIEAGKIDLKESNLDFSKILKEVVDLFKSSIRKKNLKLEVRIDPDVPTELIGDAFRLRQVLSNIIGNAVKYTLKGSIDIVVSQKHVLSDHKIMLEVHVKDTGIGIDSNHKNNLFTSFYQVDDSNTRKYGGSGLGLVISKNLVELMGGTIWVESKFGVGSEFIFTVEMKIDMDKKTENVLEVNQRKPQSDINRNCKILLVEDDIVSRIVATKFLEKRFTNIKTAVNGQEAYELCLKEKFDIILMDVQMPVMGGYEATRLIREFEKGTQQHTIIIATTALAYDQDIADSIEAGMDAYLSKPLEKESLFEKIEKLYSWK